MKKTTDALTNSSGKIAMFADGFVDEVWEIISERASVKDYTLYTQMGQFANRIAGSGGVGLELVKKRRAFGGFAANIGYAAGRLGVDATLVGVFGKDRLDSAFEEVAKVCKVYSIDDPGVTHVFEFDDGKILMTHMQAVQSVRWKNIVDELSIETVARLLTQSDIIGVGYMSLLPAFDEIVEQICASLPQDGKARRFFFDFADFRKKDAASLRRTMGLLRSHNANYPMMLSVNEHEAAALFRMHKQTLDNTGRPIAEKAEYVRQEIGFDELIIHAPTYAVAAAAGEMPAFTQSVFCEKPLRTAGAGDTFNGGYIAAHLAGLDITERLQAANAAVGYFLRNAAFPDKENLTAQLNV
ncbi:MAG: PfkB family carbohydrate kinase [Oscillospiraceae bacterium]|nr:PfkB family carbohydrate kinase [Oscillospiraceae bacterium]